MAKAAKKSDAHPRETATPSLVRLSALFAHPMNTRAEQPTADEIAELADSIRACGLMQNLLGFIDPSAPQQVGIVAGGRRLAALKLIHGDDDPTIPVTMTDDIETARAWAGAENTARKNLTPADEIRAYGKMQAAGSTPNAIARAFAVTERHVHGRLKLAQLPDPAIDALRAGKISLDQAAALTVAPTEELLLSMLQRVVANAGQYGHYNAANIRRALTPDAVPPDDRRAVFVGIDAYATAGGRIQHDLFTSDTRLLDPDVLDQCFTAAVEQAVETFKSLGWQDAQCSADAYRDWQAVAGMEKVARIPGALTDAEVAEMDALADIAAADGMNDEQMARYDQLEAALTGDWSIEDRATATLFFHIDRNGELQIDGAYRAIAKSTDVTADSGTTGTSPAAKEETISQSLRDDLARIRTLALQAALLESPMLCVDLLTLTLTDHTLAQWQRPLAISPTRQPIIPEKPEGTSQIVELLDALPDSTQSGGAELTIDMLDAVTMEPVGDKSERLTAALARTFARTDTPFGRALARRMRVNPRDVWTPTADGYFGRLPAPMLDRIWHDLTGGLTSDFPKMKKAEKARELERLIMDPTYRSAIGLTADQSAAIDRWLPAELRIEEAEK